MYTHISIQPYKLHIYIQLFAYSETYVRHRTRMKHREPSQHDAAHRLFSYIARRVSHTTCHVL